MVFNLQYIIQLLTKGARFIIYNLRFTIFNSPFDRLGPVCGVEICGNAGICEAKCWLHPNSDVTNLGWPINITISPPVLLWDSCFCSRKLNPMEGHFSKWVCKAELRTDNVDPYFDREKNTLGGVMQNEPAAILVLEQNPPERMFEMNIKNPLRRILL